jgi:hypothetical protein
LYIFHPEISTLLGFYAAWNGRFLPTLRDTVSVHLQGSCLTLEDRNSGLSRNVGKKIVVYAA